MNLNNNSKFKDLEKFLAKVDDVESIVKGFTSKDADKQSSAMTKADELLNKESSTGFNKTIINKDAYKNEHPNGGIHAGPTMSQDQFLNALEADANTRAQARRERHKKANEMKMKANDAFKNEEYKTALSLYSEAITVAKDLTPLYTNRAMTHIKLQQYDEAIADCEMALRVESTWIKAYVVKGNALKLQKKYPEAIETYKEILTHNKDKMKLVQDYVSQAEEEQRVEELEQKAKKSIEENVPAAEGVAKLIHTIGTRLEIKHESEENMFRYYAGGFRMLSAQLKDDNSRTIFRTEGGFKILAAKPYLRKTLLGKAFAYGQQSDFACSVLHTIQSACSKCPENTTAFLQEQLMSEMMMNLMESDDKQVKRAAICCFIEFASNDKMIDTVLDIFKATWLTANLLSKDTTKLKLLEEGILCLNRYSENKRFRQDVVPEFDALVLQVFKKFIDEIAHNRRKEIPKCIQCLCTFAKNKMICQQVSSNDAFWESLLSCIDRCIHVMEPSSYRDDILSKMMDITEMLLLHSNDSTSKISPRLAVCIQPLLNHGKEHLVVKTMTVITRCLERSKEAVKSFQSSSGLVFIKKIYKSMKSEDIIMRTYALKIMCHCGQTDPTLLKNVPKFDKRYNAIRKILSLEENEADVMNQGMAALLLGCLSQLPGGMDPLVDYKEEASNVVKHMLELCRYSKNNNTRYNCVIAVGKMASNDGRILGEVRRFDGINILSKNKPPHV
uniref:tetratricopeptide repeat protein 12-like n=1 Tax=Styela clava TaxID=7725 RepID=UPI00193AB51A|nr:tetratricopeptide repeat protein 12-like [Styela clava]